MKFSAKIVLIVLVIGIPIIILIATANSRMIPELQVMTMWVRQAIGSAVATVAAVVVLIRCLNQAKVVDLVSPVIALFTGLALIDAHWTLTIPLGLVVLIIGVKEVIELIHDNSSATKT